MHTKLPIFKNWIYKNVPNRRIVISLTVIIEILVFNGIARKRTEKLLCCRTKNFDAL